MTAAAPIVANAAPNHFMPALLRASADKRNNGRESARRVATVFVPNHASARRQREARKSIPIEFFRTRVVYYNECIFTPQ